MAMLSERTLLRKIWRSMIARCFDEESRSYKYYGGRGITVCERWLRCENFLSDVSPRPSHNHSLDRWPDNNGNYEPGNVRWATYGQQARNTRRNILLPLNGEMVCAADFAEALGINRVTVIARVNRGEPLERIAHIGDLVRRRKKLKCIRCGADVEGSVASRNHCKGVSHVYVRPERKISPVVLNGVERVKFVLDHRANGAKLREIAEALNLTGERVRQLEVLGKQWKLAIGGLQV